MHRCIYVSGCINAYMALWRANEWMGICADVCVGVHVYGYDCVHVYVYVYDAAMAVCMWMPI